MQGSRYHKILRTSLLVTALMLLFDGGFVHPVTKQLSDNTLLYLASTRTSVLATVPENELNAITTALSARERELDQREAALREREIATRDFGAGEPDYSTYILAAILFILTVLIVLNYAMDWTRMRKLYRYETSMG